MFAALQGRAWGEGPRNSWFVCFNHPNTESHPAYLASTSPPKKKGARTRRQGPPPGGAPSPRHAAVREPFHFLPASPLSTRQTSGVPINFRSAAPSALGPRPGTHANRPQPEPPGPAAPPRPPPPPLRLQPCASLVRALPPGGSLRPTSAFPHRAHRPAAATPPRANLLPSALPAAKPRVTPSGREAEAGQRRREAGGARGGAAPRLIIPASRDLPGPPAAAPQGPLSPEAPPPACLRSRSGLGSRLRKRSEPAWALGSVVSQLDVRTDVLTSRPASARWGGRNFPLQT